jgi:predicted nucleotidyltransferase
MRGTTAYPAVTEELLATVVQRILAVGLPLKIVLFGSRAREDAEPDSDLDLLVVEESTIPRYQRGPRYLEALAGVFPGIDVVVWTPQEIADWAGVSNHFITTIHREGRVLYAR